MLDFFMKKNIMKTCYIKKVKLISRKIMKIKEKFGAKPPLEFKSEASSSAGAKAQVGPIVKNGASIKNC